ncbi:efflux RND transporter periplasmic adaptor subunit [Solimonas soli]|uniref:efflux RND transporter periplasmic adaptor subunit n=1 Tax=Solimonas soli TaxID=413479 RepID=UPI00047F2FB3|nr:hypothetical protein [Solimonas soli]
MSRAAAVARLLRASLWLLPLAAAAHGDDAPAPSASRPAALSLAKPLQRALAITTVRATPLDEGAPLQAVAEVLPRPEAGWRLQAPEAGRLQAAAEAWPVAGQNVAAGQLLALLRPALSERERAQRQVEIAGLRQKLGIAQVNVERLDLQQRMSGIGAEGNTYREQAQAEYETLRRQIELGEQSLDGRVEIRAAGAGRLQRVAVAAGEVVGRGQTLFELAVARPRLAVRVYDAALARGAGAARLAVDGQSYALHAVAQAPALPEAGWTLWFDFDGAAPALTPGALVDLGLRAPIVAGGADTVLLPRGSVRGAGDEAWIWVHDAPEHFTRRAVRVVAAQGETIAVRGAPAGARVACAGAALLDQYR